MVDRVLLTRITNDVECDTFLDDFTNRTTGPGEGGKEGKKVWRIASHKELEEYVGFEVKEGEVEEKGFKYRFEMWVLA
jgi:dihydrofolate reductase